MNIKKLTLGMFQVNTWLITDPATNTSAVIDTGEGGSGLTQKLLSMGINLDMILLTHAHIDHAGAVTELQEAFPESKCYLPKLELPMFENLFNQGNWFGMPQMGRKPGKVHHLIEDGEVLQIGNLKATFISTPGHSPGQGCYCFEDRVFVGDTLFQGSIGRTDLPMSNPATMIVSLSKLMELEPSLVVHSGHGPDTTIGEELESNPFLGHVRQAKGIKAKPQKYWW